MHKQEPFLSHPALLLRIIQQKAGANGMTRRKEGGNYVQ